MKSKFQPLVSVIIPTYKRSNMLPRAIDSVLKQTYQNIQIIVIDDNDPNTDWRTETEKKMQLYKDNHKIKYIRHPQNRNGSVARNTGIEQSDGEIICFLDDDDIYYPEKTQEQVTFLLTHPEFHAVYCGWDREGITIPSKKGNLSFELLSGTNLIYTNTIMMWKKDAISCGGWDETFKRHQEAAFLLRYFRSGGMIGVVEKVLVQFDVSDRSNAADPIMNEKQMDHYLISYLDMIQQCENCRKGALKDIYSYRYRGVFLNYILAKDYISAGKLYFKMIKKMPIKFNNDLLKYTLSRILRRGKK